MVTNLIPSKVGRNFKMIVTIRKDDGETAYDTDKIKDESKKTEATVTIQKVGNLEIILEALNFASATHRNHLETLLGDSPEAEVEIEASPVEESETKKVENNKEDAS